MGIERSVLLKTVRCGSSPENNAVCRKDFRFLQVGVDEVKAENAIFDGEIVAFDGKECRCLTGWVACLKVTFASKVKMTVLCHNLCVVIRQYMNWVSRRHF